MKKSWQFDLSTIVQILLNACKTSSDFFTVSATRTSDSGIDFSLFIPPSSFFDILKRRKKNSLTKLSTINSHHVNEQQTKFKPNSSGKRLALKTSFSVACFRLFFATR